MHKCFEALGKVPLKGDVNMKRRLSALVVLMLLIPFLIASTAIAKEPPEIAIIPFQLTSYGTYQNPDDVPLIYTVNGNTVVRRSELGPLTGTVTNAVVDQVPLTGANPVQAIGPGHDYGAIGIGSEFPVSVSPASTFVYTIHGNTVVRRSELGPLTGTVYGPLPGIGPGHDYGAIGQ